MTEKLMSTIWIAVIAIVFQKQGLRKTVSFKEYKVYEDKCTSIFRTEWMQAEIFNEL